jgi:hypothetical protein
VVEAVVLLVELLAQVVPVAVEMEQQTILLQATELLTQVGVEVEVVTLLLAQTAVAAALALSSFVILAHSEAQVER